MGNPIKTNSLNSGSQVAAGTWNLELGTWNLKPETMPRLIWLIAAGGLILGELFVMSWRHLGTALWADTSVLTLAPPREGIGEGTGGSLSDSPAAPAPVQYQSQPERLQGAIEQLSFSAGICGVFIPPDDPSNRSKSLDFFFLEYEAGNPRIVTDVFTHAPEVCMQASGALLKEEHPRRKIVVSGEEIPVRVLEFESPGTRLPLWVFRLTWLPQNSPYRQFESSSSLRREKFLSGLRLDSQPPARVLLAGARNYEKLEEAWLAFENLLVTRLSLEVPADRS
jgi:hypothetical protein